MWHSEKPAQVSSKTWSATVVILGCLVYPHVARKFIFPSWVCITPVIFQWSPSLLSVMFFFIISVPGDPKVVVRLSGQEDKSYTKSCGHVGSVNLHDNSRFYLTVWLKERQIRAKIRQECKNYSRCFTSATMCPMFCRAPVVSESQQSQGRSKTAAHTLSVVPTSGNDQTSLSESWNVILLLH